MNISIRKLSAKVVANEFGSLPVHAEVFAGFTLYCLGAKASALERASFGLVAKSLKALDRQAEQDAATHHLFNPDSERTLHVDLSDLSAWTQWK